MEKKFASEKLDKIKPYIVEKEVYATKLDANESFIAFSEALKQQLNEAFQDVLYNRYPDTDSEELCRLYAEYCGVEAKYVIAGNGSDEIIQMLCSGFLSSGDAVLTLKPDFSMYKFYASLMGAHVIEYQMDEDLTINIENFVKVANDEEVKLIIFSTPNNPTGTILSKKDILYIVENTNALVVVDEAYGEFGGETVIGEVLNYNNLAVLKTCSKALGLAAARIGFIIAGDYIINNFKKIKTPFNLNALSQTAAAVILKNRNLIDDNVKLIKQQTQELYKELTIYEEKLGKEVFRVFPTYSNFVYIKTVLAGRIYEGLKSRGVIIRCFGDAIRINAGSTVEHQKLVEALKEIL